ncbi:MAG: conjugative transposon protein TraM [Mucilaginibacter sp.]
METINETSGQSPLNPEFRKKRKFYLVVPLLVLPFLTMAFWALGGGSGKPNQNKQAQQKGINMSLPSAQFKQQEANTKMAIYQRAAKDSSQKSEGAGSAFMQQMGFNPSQVDSGNTHRDKPAIAGLAPNTADIQSARISAKLAAINRQISQPYAADESVDDDRPVKKLNRMMKAMNSSPGKDPEMEQLNAMLTKIQAIQNPATVSKPTEKKTDNAAFKAIPAMIDGKQKVMNGGTVRLKLTDSIRIRGEFLPKGQLLFGACQVTNQRLLLTIENVRLDKKIIPVNLTVFSLDGMPGIPAPEADLGGAAGTGADNAIQSMQLMSMDASLGAQAATGGINAAKGLFSKKVHKIKVKLKDAYPVLLKINK